MKIEKNYNNPHFGMKVSLNSNFHDVLKVAKSNNKYFELDSALNSLLHVEAPDLVIIHGVNKKNQMFSTFMCGRNSVVNNTIGCNTPAEASLRGLLDLVNKDNPKLMQLLKSKVKRLISEQEIISRYTTK